jgi:hypothetical protein
VDSRRPCGACGCALPDGQAVTLWCGRHWWPGAAGIRGPAQEDWLDYTVREEYVVPLCYPCSERHWPEVRDAIRALVWRREAIGGQ